MGGERGCSSGFMLYSLSLWAGMGEYVSSVGGKTRLDREGQCKAWGKRCAICNKPHHLATVCRSKPKLGQEKGTKADQGQGHSNNTQLPVTNAAYGFFSNTAIHELPPQQKHRY